MQRITAANYGNGPVNWKAASPTAGSVTANPSVGSAALIGTGVLRLSFTVDPGGTYQVQFKTNLVIGAWTPLGSPTLISGNLFVVDDVITNQPQRFYRLLAFP